jgi:DNA ligase-1
MIKRPMLASDYDPAKVRFPVLVQPKIDGVRGMVFGGTLTGRSLKCHANRHTTERFSSEWLDGIDGELIAGVDPTADDLCRKTTSALNTIEGEPLITIYAFDYIKGFTIDLPYSERYWHLKQYIEKAYRLNYCDGPELRIVPTYEALDMIQLTELHEGFISQGYEGTILRDPMGKFKQGRSTVKEMGLLRIKDFVESEARVTRIEEGSTNLNEATFNECGYTERSSHQANMVPNGMVGTIHGIDLKSGKEVSISPGKMTHEERIYYYANPSAIIERVVKYKFFPKGIKDKPRFPTFQSFRAESDL